jgi:hypothetical protein
MRCGDLLRQKVPNAAAAPATVSGHFGSIMPLTLPRKFGKADPETTASQETGR